MSTTSSATPAKARKRVNFRWRVVDIVVAAVVGVASGLIFLAWDIPTGPLGNILGAALPGAQGILNGGWLFAGVLGGLLIRKPGAALFTELLAAVVEALVGSQWGALTLLSGLVQGLGAEIVFAIFLYANFRLFVAILAGAAAGLAETFNDLIVWYAGSKPAFALIYGISTVISGAVVAGLLSWLVVRGLAKTGALNRFAAGRESAVRL
jgi:energy-coupling factor transport system substrate-specific component